MDCDIFLELNEAIAHLVCWTDPNSHTKTAEEIIFILPGNPGLVGFYSKFSEYLHKSTKLPVWVIGHGGHEEPNEEDIAREFGVSTVKGKGHVFNLQGQLQQKIDFITDIINKSTKIHLVGHSIGAWMTMELLKHPQIKDNIASATLLFPTLEYIADTPNGFWLNKILRKITPLIYFLIFIFVYLPVKLRSFLILTFFYFNNIPTDNLDTVLKYFRPSVIEKVLFMAFDEMDNVNCLDVDNLTSNKNKIKIVYGVNDGWAPAKRFKRIKQGITDLNMQEVLYSHAFVLNSSIEVANITKRFIMKDDAN